MSPRTSPGATAADIFYAYRILLDREPDLEGFMHYLDQLKSGLPVRQLRDSIVNSAEYLGDDGLVEISMEAGGVVVVDPGEPDFGRIIAKNRAWEPHLCRVLAETIRPGDVVVDVGANVGVMSFVAARLAGESGRVIAFEPNPRNSRCFVLGVIANGLKNVVLHNLALSDREELLSLEGASNTYLAALSSSKRNVAVQTVNGSRLLAGEPRIDFVKIDIEGYEPRAVRGLSELLQRCRPTVLCEFNPRCLVDHASVAPLDFALQIFAITGSVAVIEPGGSQTEVAGPEALIEMWKAKNRQAVADGHPDGMLHFDLLFNVR